MNWKLAILDLAFIALVAFAFAWGHYTGWHDYHRKLRGSGMAPTKRPGGRWLVVLGVAVVFGLLLRWAGVLA